MTGLWSTLTTAARLLTEVRLGYVLAALGVFLISIGLVAFRWRLILRALGCRATVWDALLTYSAGVFMGNVTPARSLGTDACRLALVRSRTGSPAKVITASIVYDRASEVPALALLGLLALVTLRSRTPAVLVALVALAALAAVPPVRRALTSRLTRWHDTLVGVPIERRAVAAAVGCSMGVWLQDIVRLILIAAAFRVGLTPSQAATMTLLRVVSGVVPVPGGVGVVEGGLIAGLVWFGVPAETAAAITIVERAILYACGTCIGALSWVFLGGRRVLNRRAVAVASATALAILAMAAPPAPAQVTTFPNHLAHEHA